jgi:hypothetical protein
LAFGFLGLSALDLLLTWRLLQTPGECFYEANPVASSLLEWGGWWGLGLFKLGCAGTVLGVVALLARWRPRAARVLLGGACLVLVLVVGYSLWLVTGPGRGQLVAVYAQRNLVDQKFREHRAYQERFTQLAQAVMEGRLTLAQAARALSDYAASLQYDALSPLRAAYQNLNDEARLAAALVREAGFILRESGRPGRRSLEQLTGQFSSTYASPLPTYLGDEPTGRS